MTHFESQVDSGRAIAESVVRWDPSDMDEAGEAG